MTSMRRSVLTLTLAVVVGLAPRRPLPRHERLRLQRLEREGGHRPVPSILINASTRAAAITPTGTTDGAATSRCLTRSFPGGDHPIPATSWRR
jgi:hypothetical protein